MTELDEIAQARALEAAQNRAPGAIVIDKNELRGVHAGDKNIVRSQIAMQITGAMQARDLGAECTQNSAPGSERLALGAEVARNVEAIDARRHHDLAAASLLGAEEQNFGNPDSV